jgi:hypothetical protein
VARVELSREEYRGRVQNFVRLAKVSVLLLQRLDLSQLLAARPGPSTGVNLSLQHPLAQRLRTDPSFGPSAWATPHAEPYSSSRSTAIRIARSRCSAGFFFGMICIFRKKASGITPGTVQEVGGHLVCLVLLSGERRWSISKCRFRRGPLIQGCWREEP